MSKLNNLSSGYKGGNNINTPKQDPTLSDSEKRNIDINAFLEVIKNRFIDNVYTKEDLECLIQCLETFKKGQTPNTIPENKLLSPLVPFIKYMLDNDKINNNHLTTQINYIQDTIDNSTPKTIDPELPTKTEGKLDLLSRGYKK